MQGGSSVTPPPSSSLGGSKLRHSLHSSGDMRITTLREESPGWVICMLCHSPCHSTLPLPFFPSLPSFHSFLPSISCPPFSLIPLCLPPLSFLLSPLLYLTVRTFLSFSHSYVTLYNQTRPLQHISYLFIKCFTIYSPSGSRTLPSYVLLQ